MKVEESTQGPPSHGIYPEWSNEERYPTNSSSKETLPEIIHPSENEQKNESIYTGISQKSSIQPQSLLFPTKGVIMTPMKSA